jgi:hypothetical protein
VHVVGKVFGVLELKDSYVGEAVTLLHKRISNEEVTRVTMDPGLHAPQCSSQLGETSCTADSCAASRTPSLDSEGY